MDFSGFTYHGAGPRPSPPPFRHTSPSRSVQRHSPPLLDGPRPNAPPRLSSPRIFRDFFSSMPDDVPRSRAVLPPATRDPTRSGEYSFPDAIQRTSRAVTSTGEAFQSRAGSSRSEIVDLTDSPPGENTEGGRRPSHNGSHSDLLFMTTHPLDTRRPTRGLSTLHEPIFGYQPTFAPGPPVEDYSDSLARARNRRVRIIARERPRGGRRLPDERVENEAIRRQQENHAAWQRTQERTRQIQEQQQELELLESLSSTPPLSSNESVLGSSRQSSPDTMPSTEQIESVDLTTVNDNTALAETLAKQRVDAIAAQKPNTSTDSGRTTLTSYKCPICMDTLRNATATICGHLFCHKCIVDTLNWSAAQKREQFNRNVRGVCPVCRKPMNTKDAPGNARNLVPLESKLLAALKRKRDEKGKGRAEESPSNGKGRATKKQKRETTEDFFGLYTNGDY